MSMTWLADPVTRSALRRSLNWIRLAPAFPALLFEASQPSHGRAERIAAMAFCLAAPQAAAGFLEAESNGRLTQMRLSGQSSAAIARSVFSDGGIWLGVAAAALLWSLTSGGMTPLDALIVAAMTALTVAGALTACTAKLVRDQIDPRITTAGLGAAGLVIGVSTLGLLQFEPPAGYMVAALLTSLIIIAERAPHLPGTIAYPAPGFRSRAAAFRLVRYHALLRLPAFYRGLCLSSSGFATALIFAPGLIPVAVFGGRPQYENAIGLALAPLVVGGVAVSLICREDAICGRLDVVRQSSRHGARSAIELIVGLWTPFIVAAAIIATFASMMAIPKLDNVLITALILVVVLPLPALEGWSRLWPTLTTIPFMLAFMMGRTFGFGVQAAIVAVLGWFAAVRTFESQERPILPAWVAVMTAGALCLAPFVPNVTIVARTVTTLMCALIFLPSQALIDPRSGALLRWGQPLIISVVVFSATTAGSGIRLGAWAAAVVVTTWFCAYRIRQCWPARPVIQAVVRLAVVVFVVNLNASPVLSPARWRLLNSPAGMLAIVVSGAILSELAYRASGSSRGAPATPRA